MTLMTFVTNFLNLINGPFLLGILTIILVLAIVGALLEWHSAAWQIAVKVMYAGAFAVSAAWLVNTALG